MTFEKKNHHFVPQFWLRRFADANGAIHSRKGQKVKVVGSNRIMQTDWGYTVFDSNWNPSDILENTLSILEGRIALQFDKLCQLGTVPTESDRIALCDFLALQACRHPDILRRGHFRAKELGETLALAHSFNSLDDFTVAVSKFGMSSQDAREAYQLLMTRSPEQLSREFMEVDALSPQDSKLPEQDALLAKSQIAASLKLMDFALLDAPSGNTFILGDTPLPQDDLSRGFSVPLSKSVAVKTTPSASRKGAITRRQATAIEVKAINQIQWENSLNLVIGADIQLLKSLV
jgi:hypothetical protein